MLARAVGRSLGLQRPTVGTDALVVRGLDVGERTLEVRVTVEELGRNAVGPAQQHDVVLDQVLLEDVARDADLGEHLRVLEGREALVAAVQRHLPHALQVHADHDATRDRHARVLAGQVRMAGLLEGHLELRDAVAQVDLAARDDDVRRDPVRVHDVEGSAGEVRLGLLAEDVLDDLLRVEHLHARRVLDEVGDLRDLPVLGPVLPRLGVLAAVVADQLRQVALVVDRAVLLRGEQRERQERDADDEDARDEAPILARHTLPPCLVDPPFQDHLGTAS